MERNTAEIIVKVVAVLAWIGAVFSFLGGLALIFGGAFLGSMMGGVMGAGMPGLGVVGGALSALGVVYGVIMIALALLYAYTGTGLWNFRNWARIVTLVFAVIAVLGIFSLDFVSAIIGAVMVWLFGFEKTVVGLFGATAPASVAAVVKAPVKKAAAKKKRQ